MQQEGPSLPVVFSRLESIPSEVLSHALSYVSSPSDVYSLLLSCRGIHDSIIRSQYPHFPHAIFVLTPHMHNPGAFSDSEFRFVEQLRLPYLHVPLDPSHKSSTLQILRQFPRLKYLHQVHFSSSAFEEEADVEPYSVLSSLELLRRFSSQLPDICRQLEGLDFRFLKVIESDCEKRLTEQMMEIFHQSFPNLSVFHAPICYPVESTHRCRECRLSSELPLRRRTEVKLRKLTVVEIQIRSEDELCSLFDQAPNLKTLQCQGFANEDCSTLPWPMLASDRLRLPLPLEKLEIDDYDITDCVMRRILQSCPSLREFSTYIPGPIGHLFLGEEDLRPFHSLRRLILSGDRPTSTKGLIRVFPKLEVFDGFLDQIEEAKGMVHCNLRELVMANYQAFDYGCELLKILLKCFPQLLRWEGRLPLLDDMIVPPSLQHFSCAKVSEGSFVKQLSRLPKLRSLSVKSLDFLDSLSPRDFEALPTNLAIEKLELSTMVIGGECLTWDGVIRLVNQLPRLAVLLVEDVVGSSTVNFRLNPRVTRFSTSTKVPPSAYSSFPSLRRLCVGDLLAEVREMCSKPLLQLNFFSGCCDSSGIDFRDLFLFAPNLNSLCLRRQNVQLEEMSFVISVAPSSTPDSPVVLSERITRVCIGKLGMSLSLASFGSILRAFPRAKNVFVGSIVLNLKEGVGEEEEEEKESTNVSSSSPSSVFQELPICTSLRNVQFGLVTPKIRPQELEVLLKKFPNLDKLGGSHEWKGTQYYSFVKFRAKLRKDGVRHLA